jgi:AcrR family transcriptional regulator
MTTSPTSEPLLDPEPVSRFDARRTEIVDIAARLFAAHGYHATSVDDLCEATNLKRGGLYHYIGSKEELLYAIHERFIEPLLASAHAVEARGASPEATLRGLSHVLMDVIADFNDQVTVFLHEWRSVADKQSERAQRVRQARHDFESVIERTLERGVADGSFVPRKPALAVLAFLGMINYAYQWYRPDGDYTAGEVADVFCDIYLLGTSIRR